MKTWRIEIEVQTDDAVTQADMQEVADKIADDATLRVCDEIPGHTIVLLGDVDYRGTT